MLASWTQPEPTNTLVAAGDRFLITANTLSSPWQDIVAYEPSTGQRWPIESPVTGSFRPERSMGSVVVAEIKKPVPATHDRLTGIAIIDLFRGTSRLVWPASGYDALYIDGMAEGYAYGQMLVYGSGPFVLRSRAIVIDLGTGVLRDITPADMPRQAITAIASVSDGRALVASFPGTVAGERPVGAVDVVNIASGTTVSIVNVDRLATSGEGLEHDELWLDGGLVVGRLKAGDGVAHPFVFEYPMGSFDTIELPADVNGACRYRLDVSHLVCYANPVSGSGAGWVFVYDVEMRESITVPTTGLSGPVWPVALAGADIVIEGPEIEPSLVLVYDTRSGTLYKLGASPGQGGLPNEFSVFSNRLFGTLYGAFGSRVWELP